MHNRLALSTAALAVTLVFAGLLFAGPPAAAAADRRPNVVVIITDDQGYGDLGFHGNPVIQTPHLDALARQSVRLKHFYVSPVCSPTRASLLTGRYNYRTGVVDTYIGRSMMRPAEVTLAEMLGGADYRTGIFGKWHLGDNYPMRPADQGFAESLVHKGGGIAQPADPPGGDSYFDPTLLHNGKAVKTKGYCSDVYTDAAVRFVEESRGRPFFLYLAFNAPHDPLQVPDAYRKRYERADLARQAFPADGQPLPEKLDRDAIGRVYGMVTNIDDNVGRLLGKLDALKLAEDTIVVFLTDNGPAFPRYNGGLRGLKGTVYDGGIRVPCFVRWPAALKAGREVDRIAAHIDLAPTLLDACGVAPPAGVRFDGRSLLPLLRDDAAADWPDRALFFQWHRGDAPEPFRACAARTQRWKLVQPAGVGGPLPAEPRFELYDMQADPYERNNLAAQHPDVVRRLKDEYAAWFKDVGAAGYDPPRIVLGSDRENPTLLTRQDWRGPRAGWGPKNQGHWEVDVAAGGGTYEFTLYVPAGPARTARLRVGELPLEGAIGEGATTCVVGPADLPAGPARLEAWATAGEETAGAHYVEVHRLK